MTEFIITDDIYHWITSMADVYKYSGVDFTDCGEEDSLFPTESDRNVKNIFYNQETDKRVKDALKSNLRCHPRYNYYTEEYIDRMIVMDLLQFSPVVDNSIADNIIIVDIGRKVKDEDRYKFN